MPDFLDKLIDDATRRLKDGYYDIDRAVDYEPVSLRNVIRSARNNAIIAEIKASSPSRGVLRPGIDPVDAAMKLAKGGAVGLSVLTEPDNFGGNIQYLSQIRQKVSIPLLMKDVIIDERQIQAARKSGGDCILLIQSVFSKPHLASVENLIEEAHRNQVEVLLEVHDEPELNKALKTQAELIGVNNRNLATLQTDLSTSANLLRTVSHRGEKVLLSESGFETPDDVRKLKTSADGFLIGSSIMLSQDMESKVREFVLA